MKNFTTSIILLCCIFTLQAQIIHVPGDYSTIQAGIDAATHGDTVLVAEDTYLENIRFNGKAIIVASEFLLDGELSHIENTIIDGSQPVDADSASVVTFSRGVDSSSVLCGLTITKGKGTYYTHPWGTRRVGGGIFIEEGSGGTIEDCIVRDNHLVNDIYQWGGGICVMLGEVGNTELKRTVLIRDNIIRNNSLSTSVEESSSGGGIKVGIGNELKHGRIIIENNVIDSNLVKTTHTQGRAIGGGMNFGMVLPTPPGEYIIRNNIFAYNKLEGPGFVRGAGMMVIHIHTIPTYYEDLRPAPYIYNNLVYKNESPGYAGGIAARITLNIGDPDFLTLPQPVFINNTIADNKSQFGVGFYSNNSAALLMNNIFSNDLSRVGASEIVRIGVPKNFMYHNLISDGIIPDDTYHSGNISGDPYLTADYHLSDTSPCIGRGIGSKHVDEDDYLSAWYYAPGYDFNDNIRPNPVDEYVDMGALESLFEAPDLEPPVLTLHSNDILGIGKDIMVTSSEGGMVYLMSVNVGYPTLEYIQTNALDSVEVIADSTAIISTASLEQKDYWLFASDSSGNISQEIKVTLLDLTPPVLTVESDTVEQNDLIYVTSTKSGYVYIVPVGTPVSEIEDSAIASVKVEGGVEKFILTTGLDVQEYWVFAVDENLVTSDHVTILIIGIPGKISSSLKIYPNPVRDFIHLDIDQTVSSIKLYNVFGIMILEDVSAESCIDLSRLNKGIYFIRIQTGKGDIYTGKVLKE